MVGSSGSKGSRANRSNIGKWWVQMGPPSKKRGFTGKTRGRLSLRPYPVPPMPTTSTAG